MYIQGFIVPVPGDKQDAYKDVAEKFWPIVHDNGAIEHVECWEADVNDGKRMVYGGFEPIVDEGKPVGGYVDGFVAPVPDAKREEYRAMAEKAAAVFMDHGAVRDLEAWGVDVPYGEVTSFPRSVEAEDGESVVFSFVEWPDEQARNEGWAKLMEDERMKNMDMPFDGKRMFYGGFKPIVAKGR